MLSNLSQRILDYIRARPEGVKIATLEVMVLKDDGGRYPPQEIEAAVSQLKRANFITQRRPGEWMPATEGSIHVEREPDYARIRERDVVDRRPELDADFPAVSEARAFAESPRTNPPPIPRQPAPAPTQERTTMAKAKKTCTKCDKAKAPQAFFAGDDVCRACRKGPKASKKPPAKEKLRAIVRKVTARKGGAIHSALDELRARRGQIADDLANLDALIAGLERVEQAA